MIHKGSAFHPKQNLSGLQAYPYMPLANQFRYSIWQALIFAAVGAACLPGIIFLAGSSERGAAACFGISALFMFSLSAWALLFRIDLDGDVMQVRTALGCKTIRLSEVRLMKQIDRQGGRGPEKMFYLQDGQWKIVLKADSNLERFDELIDLLKRRIPAEATFRHRDNSGMWLNE